MATNEPPFTDYPVKGGFIILKNNLLALFISKRPFTIAPKASSTATQYRKK